MGEFLIAPLAILAVALLMWLFFAAGKASKARRELETLPDEPYAREQEQIRRLKADHAETRAEDVTHPARRP